MGTTTDEMLKRRSVIVAKQMMAGAATLDTAEWLNSLTPEQKKRCYELMRETADELKASEVSRPMVFDYKPPAFNVEIAKEKPMSEDTTKQTAQEPGYSPFHPCAACCVKHLTAAAMLLVDLWSRETFPMYRAWLARAWILRQEAEHGYPDHELLVQGALSAAEGELRAVLQRNPGMAHEHIDPEDIRRMRRGQVPIPPAHPMLLARAHYLEALREHPGTEEERREVESAWSNTSDRRESAHKLLVLAKQMVETYELKGDE